MTVYFTIDERGSSTQKSALSAEYRVKQIQRGQFF